MKKNKSSQVLETVSDNENMTDKDIHKENCLSNTTSFDSNDIEDKISTRKVITKKYKQRMNS